MRAAHVCTQVVGDAGPWRERAITAVDTRPATNVLVLEVQLGLFSISCSFVKRYAYPFKYEVDIRSGWCQYDVYAAVEE